MRCRYKDHRISPRGGIHTCIFVEPVKEKVSSSLLYLPSVRNLQRSPKKALWASMHNECFCAPFNPTLCQVAPTVSWEQYMPWQLQCSLLACHLASVVRWFFGALCNCTQVPFSIVASGYRIYEPLGRNLYFYRCGVAGALSKTVPS